MHPTSCHDIVLVLILRIERFYPASIYENTLNHAKIPKYRYEQIIRVEELSKKTTIIKEYQAYTYT